MYNLNFAIPFRRMSIACCLCLMALHVFPQPPLAKKSKGVSISGDVVSGGLPASPQDTLDKLAQVTELNYRLSHYGIFKTRFQKMDVSGVLVTIKSKNSAFTAMTKTDPNGKFVFDGLEENYYEIIAEKEFARDGHVIKAKGRALLRLDERDFASIRLRTELVTLRGKILSTNGKPISGLKLRADYCIFAEDSAVYRLFPPQFSTTLPDGSYELPDLEAPGFEAVASYLMSGDSIVGIPEYEATPFSVMIYDESNLSDKYNLLCKLPLIAEENATFARRYMVIMNKLSPPTKKFKGWVEKEGIVLPKSTGNVIYVPDIIVSKGMSISGVVDGSLDASPQDKLEKLGALTNVNQMCSLYDNGKTRFQKMDVSGVLVTVKSRASSFTATAKTDQEGKFVFGGLEDSLYEIIAEKEFVRDGHIIKARGYDRIKLDERNHSYIRLSPDWVTLKGKVINGGGNPMSGLKLMVAQCPYTQSGDVRNRYPPQYANTAPDGSYEIQNLVGPDFMMVSDYLLNTNVLSSSSVYADRPFSVLIFNESAMACNLPLCDLPLITEENVSYARRYISLLKKINSPSPKWKEPIEQEGIVLPKSKGNVIFVPDIILREK